MDKKSNIPVNDETIRKIKRLGTKENDMILNLLNRYNADNLRQISQRDAELFYNREILWAEFIKDHINTMGQRKRGAKK